tara:strand:- start:960 stop:1262 length:303 start_codon:yes stop_codon:yes gene_type:complete
LIAIKDVLPDVPILHQLEFVYQLTEADRGFDPEFAAEATESSEQWKSAKQLRLRRATQLLALHDLDHAIAPTHCQTSTAGDLIKNRISVINEGIDTHEIC